MSKKDKHNSGLQQARTDLTDVTRLGLAHGKEAE